jgi:hypothetical protein
MKRHGVRFAILDLLLLAAAFVFAAWLKRGTMRYYLPNHSQLMVAVAVVWLLVSWFAGKYSMFGRTKARAIFVPFIQANVIVVALTALLMYMIQDIHWSRPVIFATFLTASAAELGIAAIYYPGGAQQLAPPGPPSRLTRRDFPVASGRPCKLGPHGPRTTRAQFLRRQARR